jgi:hypothetical protein
LDEWHEKRQGTMTKFEDEDRRKGHGGCREEIEAGEASLDMKRSKINL